MAEKVRVAAFEGGELRLLSGTDGSGEAVLALPLARLLVKMIRVPAEARDDPAAFALPVLKAMSPYPDEDLAVSCETVREDAAGLIVLAAAFPESSGDDIAEALDAKKLDITRIDVLEIGALRGLWTQLPKDDARRLVLMKGPDGIGLVALDGEMPSAVRAVRVESDLRREVMLSLLEAEDFGGPKALAEIVVVRSGEEVSPSDDFSALASFAPVRGLAIGEEAALAGVAARSGDPEALNALPASWSEVLGETRFKAKLVQFLTVAVGIWVLVMAALFSGPYLYYGYRTDRLKKACRSHSAEYNRVKTLRDKVELVGKYSDHSRGALEIMKAVSDRLPPDVEVTSWDYKRGDVLKLSGVAVEGDGESPMWAFKEKLDAMSGEGDDQPVYPLVKLTKNTTTSDGKRNFDIELRPETEEEEAP